MSTRSRPGSSGRPSHAHFDAKEARGPIIDQDGLEIPQGPFQGRFNGAFDGAGGIRFDFNTANPFGNLSREQRMARLEAVAKLLDVAFVLPGTNIRYGIDGIIGLIPVVGDLIATALSLWLVRRPAHSGRPGTWSRACSAMSRSRA